jgi:hypothetical protein
MALPQHRTEPQKALLKQVIQSPGSRYYHPFATERNGVKNKSKGVPKNNLK